MFGLLPTVNLKNLLAWILLICAGAIFATSLINATYYNLDYFLTSVRLAPTFALWKGYPLYSTTTEGPWVMIGYGPFYPLMYTPSLLASTPVPAVAIATLLSHAYILLPVCLLIRLASNGENRPRLQAIMVTILLYPLFILMPSLQYVISRVHVDAPALGFILLNAWFLLRYTLGDQPNVQRAACLTGVGLGLAIACKANLTPALFLFAGWFFWFHDLRAMASFLGCSGITVAGIYALTCVFNDPQAILLNFQVLGNFPWSKMQWPNPLAAVAVTAPADKLSILAQKMIDICKVAGPTVLAVAVSLYPATRCMTNRRLPAATAPVLGVFFLLLALTMLLPAGASVAKWGGAITVGHSSHCR